MCVDSHPFSWAGEALDSGFEPDSASLDLYGAAKADGSGVLLRGSSE